MPNREHGHSRYGRSRRREGDVVLRASGPAVGALGSVGMVKYGLFAINYGTCANPKNAVRVARHAEEAGFESVWTGEHLVLPDPQPGSFSMPPTLPFLDTIVALTLVAAETSSIKVASGIIELPLHHPVTLAKQLASIDQVSGGRLIVGVGAGYVEAEFAAMGVELSERGGRMDEHLDAMRALWSMPQPKYHGRFVDFAGVNAFPRPVHPVGPSIVMGGESARARRRAIAKAHGWYCFNTTIEWAHEALQVITTEQEQYERPAELGPLEITMTPMGPFDRSVADQYQALGVDRLVLLPNPDASAGRRHEPVPVDDILRTIDRTANMIRTP
jgi:probable F420-dependent oxidoreductase